MSNQMLMANVCNMCSNVWFVPSSPAHHLAQSNHGNDGEPITCPYCKVVLSKQGGVVDLTDDSAGVDNEETKPWSFENEKKNHDGHRVKEHEHILEEKSKYPLIEKVCVFCKSRLFISEPDINLANHCPHCGDTLTISKVQRERGGGTMPNKDQIQSMMEKALASRLDTLKFKPITLYLKKTEWWNLKPKPRACTIMDICRDTGFIRIHNLKDESTEWVRLTDIVKIVEPSMSIIDEITASLKDLGMRLGIEPDEKVKKKDLPKDEGGM